MIRKYLASVLALLSLAGPAHAGVIFVTSTEQKISGTGGCSLQEAIAAANYDNNIAISKYDRNNQAVFVQTQCVRKGDVNDPDDLIVLPVKATFFMSKVIDDADNYMGPTATPMIRSRITIDARGSRLQFVPTNSPGLLHEFHPEPIPVTFRAFAIGADGALELRSAYIRGFTAVGGNGGFIRAASEYEARNFGGGGGGMGAGGAIYVHGGSLLVLSTTFEDNAAIGGNGAAAPDNGGGGGGGLGGWGGLPSCTFDIAGNGQGGGGGGARGFGMGSCAGPGGGTVTDATNFAPGFACGGNAGDLAGDLNGGDAPCPGGGGGGGRTASNRDGGGDGGKGSYGGGGGGGSNGGGGGRGGFGGGGGAGWEGLILGHTGGDGGFGGGGGAGDGDSPGSGGRYDGASWYGGNGGSLGGGGGAGLGGAIFNHEGSVVVRNSTFSGNYVAGGIGGLSEITGLISGGRDGQGAGAAIFSVNGRLVVEFTTVDGNVSTNTDGGITVVQTSSSRATSFALRNSIVSNNGDSACRVRGSDVAKSFVGNVIEDNVNCGTPVSTADPILGALQNNQGLTPTKAIAKTSPARDTADPSVTIGVDQRGQERVATSSDNGAFELCLIGFGALEEPCIITAGIGEISLVKLNVDVAPAGGGTTTPAAGEHDVELNSVVTLNAVPNTSYRFASWTGDEVGDATKASTFIAMDAAKSITANFELFDFNFSPIAPLSVPVGTNGSTTVTVNSMGVFAEPVALSISGLPSGVFASFNPGTVIPVAGQSVNSQLTVSLAPYALPGSYTLTVSGSGGGRQHSKTVALTIAPTPAGITQVINSLVALGCVDNSGVGNAFTTKLAQAQAAISAGDTQTAINILTALLRQLQAQSGKHLKTTCTSGGQTFNPVDVLVAQVQGLLTSLGATLKANPLIGTVVGTGGVEVKGALVSVLNAAKNVVATAETDATGFYFFPKTSALTVNADYTAKVTLLPKPWRKATPAAQTFTWKGSAVSFATVTVQ